MKVGKGGPKNVPRSRELLRRACRRGQPEACIRLAKRTLWLAKGKPTPVDAVRADLKPIFDSLEPICQAGHREACTVLLQVAKEPLPKPDAARVAGLEEQLASLRPAALNRARARLGFRCKEGDFVACSRLAKALRDGDLGQKDNNGARAAAAKVEGHRKVTHALYDSYLDKRCRKGSIPACFIRSHALRHGRFGRTDTKAADRHRKRGQQLAAKQARKDLATYRKRCASSDAFACLMVARALRSGRGTTKNLDKARELELRAEALQQERRKKWAEQERR